jgi:hypothetical protein
MSQTNEIEKSDSLDMSIEAYLSVGEDHTAYHRAIANLMRWHGAAAEALVHIFLDKTRPKEVREQAAWPLRQIRGRRARRLLTDAALYNPDEWVRVEAVSVLSSYYSDRLTLPMLSILQNRRNSPKLRSEAAHTLGMIHTVFRHRNVYSCPDSSPA